MVPKFSLLLFPLFSVCILANDAPAKKFAGTWEAKFNGSTFCVLKIQAGDSAQISGSMTGVDINVDDEGNLRSVEARSDEFPILRPALESGNLRFEWSDDSGEAPLKFELKVTGDREAQLTFLSVPEGMKIKPLVFTKTD